MAKTYHPAQPKDHYPFAVQRAGLVGMELYDTVLKELTSAPDPWDEDVARHWIQVKWDELVEQYIPPTERMLMSQSPATPPATSTVRQVHVKGPVKKKPPAKPKPPKK